VPAVGATTVELAGRNFIRAGGGAGRAWVRYNGPP
jgi:hypothetical protein